jgi:hypothetical protein
MKSKPNKYPCVGRQGQQNKKKVEERVLTSQKHDGKSPTGDSLQRRNRYTALVAHFSLFSFFL